MEPESFLRQLCARHGVAYADAGHLVPLVRRALGSSAVLRERILFLVESNLARKASGARPSDESVSPRDHEVLVAVAKVLHEWAPAGRVLEMGGVLPKLFPEGFDAEPPLGER